MSLIEKYKKYRKIAVKLISKIMHSCLDRNKLMNSAKLLGIDRGDIFLFDSEDETSVLMDFALNDYQIDNKNAIEVYQEKIGGESDIEKEILDSLLSSYTSLFEITSISESDNTLFLNDILNKKDSINLIDIAFSKTAIPGLLLFIRLVPFTDFNMTSGVSFVFFGDLQKYLLSRYKKLRKRIKSDNEAIKRFVSFYELNKTHGLEVKYAFPFMMKESQSKAYNVD